MSISTTLTWSVANTVRDLSDGFIVSADVVLTGIATNTVGSASTTKTHSITSFVGFGTVRPDPMIAYNDVTEANVVGWAKTALGIGTVTQFESIIPVHLGGLLEPLTNDPNVGSNQVSGTPW
tara:strand:+ start:547 stop:912 length:366 start_codon:yes stop_codon:yes gene_type:complete